VNAVINYVLGLILVGFLLGLVVLSDLAVVHNAPAIRAAAAAGWANLQKPYRER
jgi:hypothetical protein